MLKGFILPAYFLFTTSVYSYIEKKFDLLVVTVATEETDGLKRLRISAEEYGLELAIFGLGMAWKGGSLAKSTVSLIKYRF